MFANIKLVSIKMHAKNNREKILNLAKCSTLFEYANFKSFFRNFITLWLSLLILAYSRITLFNGCTSVRTKNKFGPKTRFGRKIN